MLHPLHLGPNTPAWILAAVWPVLMVHIAAGLIAIPAGFVAVAARKGARLHRAAGNVFFVSMLLMAGLGSVIAMAEVNRPTAVIGVFACYLTATAWATARRRDGESGRFLRFGLVVVLAVAAAEIVLGLMGMNSPTGRIDRLPWQPAILIGVVAAIAAVSDLRVIRRGVSGASRIARHVWRMCTALFIASGSFFLGQQKVMPEAVQGSPILVVLALAPLVLMVFWLLRVRFSKAFRAAPGRAGLVAAARSD